MLTRTKIICTIGPAVKSEEQIVELLKAGMNVARLNFSHGTQEEHLHSINLLKKARESLEVPLSIMLDTRGPEVRIGLIDGKGLILVKGDHWRLVKDEVVGNKE
ncbi:MAG TPA: pyruvate kinase, partial [Waddliaceae bacterium]